MTAGTAAPAPKTWQPPGQFLTAVFELRPSRRKAAALTRIRDSAEDAFWAAVEQSRAGAIAAVAGVTATSPRAVRDVATGFVKTAHFARGIYQIARGHGLASPVIGGVVRDVQAAISSFVGLTIAGLPAEYPERPAAKEADFAGAIRDLGASITIEDERAARDSLAKIARPAGKRPFCLSRAEECRIVRDARGRLAAVLQVVAQAKTPKIAKKTKATKALARAARRHAFRAHVRDGMDATTGEIVEAYDNRHQLVIPLSCSKWHENKFLNGRATLGSALVFERGGRWFLAAQFQMPHRKIEVGAAVVGVDRGCVNPVALAVVDGSGAVAAVPGVRGAEIGKALRRSEDRKRSQQRRRGVADGRHIRFVDDALHRIANEIVALAKKHGARVVIEQLGNFKEIITAKRTSGARKRGWRKVLKAAQLGKLEQILTYKLNLAGLPKLRAVAAGGTSTTCPACATQDKNSRPAQDKFACVACGFTHHADENAAVAIARRGVMVQKLTKGQRYADLHKNMVERLRSRDDGGLGPLASCRRVVVAPASADTAYERESASAATGLTVSAGQEVTRTTGENALTGVLAARAGRVFKGQKEEIRGASQGVVAGLSGLP